MKKITLAISIFLLCWAAPLPAEVITYQGRLKESGLPANGNREFIFAVCDAETGGSCLSSSSGAQYFSVQNGLFKSTFTLPAVGLAGGEWHLQVTVGGVSLSPRERLTAVPYAVYSASSAYSIQAVQRSGDNMTGQLTLNGSTLTVGGSEFSVGGSALALKNGRVGIGTDSPAYLLDAGGDMRIFGGNDQPTLVFSQNASDIPGVSGYSASISGVPESTARGILFRTQAQGAYAERFRVTGTGDVGISTGTPAARLDVLAGGATPDSIAQIWRDSSGAVVSSVSATGVVMGVKFIGDGSGLLNVAAATGVDASKLPLTGGTMGGDIVMSGNAIYSASTITAAGDVTAARYQISGSTVLSVGMGNTLIVGLLSGGSNTGSLNTFVGSNAGYANAAASNNAFIGSFAGYANTSGNNNTFIGPYAGYSNSAAGDNVFVGGAAGYSNDAGTGNVFMGDHSGYSNSGGNSNVFIGNKTGYYNTAGADNAVVGNYAGYYNPSGSANTILGQAAGYGASGFPFSNATLVGYQAGYSLMAGTDNVFLGYKAGRNVTAGSGNIVIGSGMGTPDVNSSNTLNIGGVLFGDLAAGTIGISTGAPQAALDVVATGLSSADMAQLWRNSAGAVVSSVSATGVVMGVKFIGDGSGLLNVAAVTGVDASKVAKAGDTMTGQLTLAGSTLTVTGGKLLVSALGTEMELLSDVGGGHINTLTSQYLALGTGGTTRLLIDNLGKVAINKTPPNYLFDVGGAANFDGQAIVGGTLTVAGDAFSVGGSTLVVAGGMVGIGMASPQAGLDVLALPLQTVALFRNAGAPTVALQSDSGAPQKVTLGFNSWSSSEGGLRNMAGITSEANGDLSFLTTNAGSTLGQERLRVKAAGNIGIGTALPDYLFTVQKDAPSVSVDPIAGFFNPSLTDGYFLTVKLGKADSDNNAGLIGYKQDPAGSILGLGVQGDNVLDGGAGLVVKKLGVVGIGTNSPQGRLDVWSTGAGSGDMVQIWRDSAGTVVSSVSAVGYLQAARFIGDGSGLTNVAAATGVDASKVSKAGDTMTGQLTLAGSSLTVTGSGLSVGATPTNRVLVEYSGGIGHVSVLGGALALNNSGQNVGIGTTLPAYVLDVNGAIRGRNQLIVDGTATVQGNAFSVGGSTFLVQGGKIGINNAAPLEALDVGAGNIRLAPGQTLQWGSAANSISASGTGMTLSENSIPRLHVGSTGGAATVALGDYAAVTIDTTSAVHAVAEGAPGSDGRVAVFGDLRSNGSTAGQYLASGNFETNIDGPDGADLAVGVRALIRRENPGAGVVTKAYGVLVDDIQNQSGVITDTYGLYIGDQTLGAQTNTPYALYSADPGARTYFAGNVGIGTAVPGAALDVSGMNTTVAINSTNTTSANALEFRYSGVPVAHLKKLSDTGDLQLNSGNSSLTVVAGGNIRMAVESGGNVAIGNITPSYKLDVDGTMNASGGLCIAGNCKSDWNSAGVWSKTGVVVSPATPTDNVLVQSTLTVAGNAFSVAGSTLAVASGNLGIGIAAPTEMLHVFSNQPNKAHILVESSGSNGNPSITVKANTPAGGASLVLSRADTGAPSAIQFDTALGVNWRMETAADATYSLGLYNQTTQSMRFLQDGKVGIGPGSPTSLLHLNAAAPTTANPMLLAADTAGTGEPQLEVRSNGYRGRMSIAGSSGEMYVGTLTNNPVIFQSNGADRMRILSGGNVGINTPTPGSMLDVNGDINTSGSLTAGGNVLVAGQFKGANAGFTFMDTNNFRRLQFNGTGTALFDQADQQTVTIANGQVGIGTASPAYALHITSGDASGWLPDVMIESTASGTPQLLLRAGGHEGRIATSGSNGGTYIGSVTNDFVSLQSNGIERIRIAAGGDVGILTSAPGATLDIGDGANTTTRTLRVWGGGGGGDSASLFLRIAAIQASLTMDAASSNLTVTNPYDSNNDTFGGMIFKTRATQERMRITKAGYIGMGTSAPRYRLELSSAAGSSDNILVVSTGTDIVFGVKGNGEVYGAKFIGDGSGLVNVVMDGGAMTQTLSINADTTAYPYELITTGLVISTGGALQTTGLGNGTIAGNARGNGAVDLQTWREAGTQVASGVWSTIGGGRRNKADSDYATVSGGDGNSASFGATVGGGMANTAGLTGAVVGGGSSNSATGMLATIAGGYFNRATWEYAAVGGGLYNVVSGSNSVIAGGAYNTVTGTSAVVAGGELNTARNLYSFVGGGRNNTAYDGYTVVSGGNNNYAGAWGSFIGGGSGNNTGNSYAAIVGGLGNATGPAADYAFLGGGYENDANGVHAAIGGGWFNVANAMEVFIGGGGYNTADGQYGVISGGKENKLRTEAYAGFIGGGERNISTAPYSTVGGGLLNTSSGTYSAVLGGHNNQVYGSAASIAGGENNYAGGYASFVGAGLNNQAPGNYSAIGGGNNNSTDWGEYAFLGGGQDNIVSSNTAAMAGGYQNRLRGQGSFIGGGWSNENHGLISVIAGGSANMIHPAARYSGLFAGQDNVIFSGDNAVIAGGYTNSSQNDYTTISGGLFNFANGYGATVAGGANASAVGQYAFVAGGNNNTAKGDYSFAGGNKSSSTANGTFTWNDSLGTQLDNTVANQVMFKAAGGFWVSSDYTYVTPGLFVNSSNDVGIGTNAPGFKLHVAATTGGGIGGTTLSGSSTDAAVYGWTSTSATAIKGVANTGYAGRFEGNVYVTNSGVNPPLPAKLQVNGDLGLGDGTAPGNAPVVIWLTAAGAVQDGDIVIASGGNQFSTTVTGSDYRAIGVALGATAGGSVGKVAVGGVALVNCAAGPTAGQHAVASATAGQAAGMNSPAAGSSIGQFLTGCGTPSAGKAYLLLN